MNIDALKLFYNWEGCIFRAWFYLANSVSQLLSLGKNTKLEK